jgi:carbonic anhydrase
MEPILRGMLEFQQRVYPEHRELFQRLRKGQSPQAMLITCSDSRIDPALVMGTQPGDIFIVRNAGNIVPPAYRAGGGEAASLEYAVCVLGIEDIIVCGHSQCGAMSGLLEPGSLEALPYVRSWVAHARDALSRARSRASNTSADEMLHHCVECNVIVQLEHLQTYPFIAERLRDGCIRLHGLVYHFEKGRIDYYEAAQNRFVPLQEATASNANGINGVVAGNANIEEVKG